MGHGVTTYAAPHALTVLDNDPWDSKHDWHEVVTGREAWVEREEERLYEDGGDAAADAWTPPDTYQINGWVVTNVDGCWETETHKNIWATVLRKGDQKVYALNSSQYSHVGEHELTVFADDLETLVDFCNDTGLDSFQIESPGVVEQWG